MAGVIIFAWRTQEPNSEDDLWRLLFRTLIILLWRVSQKQLRMWGVLWLRIYWVLVQLAKANLIAFRCVILIVFLYWSSCHLYRRRKMLWRQTTSIFFIGHYIIIGSEPCLLSSCQGKLQADIIVVPFLFHIPFHCLLFPQWLLKEIQTFFVLRNLYPSYILESLPTISSFWVAWWQFHVLADPICNVLDEGMKSYFQHCGEH